MNNKKANIIITLLVILIVLFIGYILFDQGVFTNKKEAIQSNEIKEDNKSVENNNQTNNQEENKNLGENSQANNQDTTNTNTNENPSSSSSSSSSSKSSESTIKKSSSSSSSSVVQKQSNIYAGRYSAIDGDPRDSYIILKEDYTLERNVNMCEGYYMVIGKYNVSEKNGNVTITFVNEKYKDSGKSFDWMGNTMSFTFKNNKLSLINPKNEYAYYDCSNVKTFKK